MELWESDKVKSDYQCFLKLCHSYFEALYVKNDCKRSLRNLVNIHPGPSRLC